MRRLSVALLIASAVAPGPARAADVSVQDAWARATATRAQTAAVYLSITNKGGPDKLIAVSTPVAGKASVHETVKKGSVVGMRPMEGGLPITTSGPTVLAPGGYHIMLMQLQKPLEKGSSFPLALTFEKAGKLEATAHVEAADANGPMQDQGPGHDMDAMPSKEH